MEDPEWAVRVVSEIVGLALGLVVLDQATDGAVRRAGLAFLHRLRAWWDHRSYFRMILDAFESGRATIEEGERWRTKRAV